VRLIAAAVVLAGCAGTFDVPTGRMPIAWERDGRRGHWAKGGVQLQGWTCGEQCRHTITLYGAMMSVFVLAPLAGIAASEAVDHRVDGGWFDAGVGIGGAAFLVGFAAAFVAISQQDEAVDIYNRSR
jgi:hypothetical protein